MKHRYTPKQMQAAVDEAFQEAEITDFITDEEHAWWKPHSPFRLALARELLERLPEPTPPVVDGKEPAEVAFEAAGYIFKWESCQNKDRWHRVASAVLATFGNQSLEAAIARMEAVSIAELQEVWHMSNMTQHFKAIKDHLITAARGESQPPASSHDISTCDKGHKFRTIASHPAKSESEWECPHCLVIERRELRARAENAVKSAEEQTERAARFEARAEKAEADVQLMHTALNQAQTEYINLTTRAEKSESELARIFAAAHVAGWNGVWDLAEFIKSLAQQVRDLETECSEASAQFSNYRDKVSLPQLRPISEAGPVPDGCARYYFQIAQGFMQSCGTLEQSSDDTHFADIRLPVEEKPTHETFEAHGKTWTRHTPGNPMPCDAGVMVEVMLGFQMRDNDVIHPERPSAHWDWDRKGSSTSIIGWRYADEPAPETPLEVKEWTPKVGDRVQLKSGGPEMTVESISKDSAFCRWFDMNGSNQLFFNVATLKPAKEGAR